MILIGQSRAPREPIKKARCKVPLVSRPPSLRFVSPKPQTTHSTMRLSSPATVRTATVETPASLPLKEILPNSENHPSPNVSSNGFLHTAMQPCSAAAGALLPIGGTMSSTANVVRTNTPVFSCPPPRTLLTLPSYYCLVGYSTMSPRTPTMSNSTVQGRLVQQPSAHRISPVVPPPSNVTAGDLQAASVLCGQESAIRATVKHTATERKQRR